MTRSAPPSPACPTRYLFNNTCQDILAVAGAMLDGELEYRHGNFDEAFGHLRRAIALDDALPYDEPWGWMQPTRHALGALLLEQGRVEDAETIYAEDLGYDPRSHARPGTRGTSGACTATTSASFAWGSPSRRGSSSNSSMSPSPAPTSRSSRHASAARRAKRRVLADGLPASTPRPSPGRGLRDSKKNVRPALPGDLLPFCE